MSRTQPQPADWPAHTAKLEQLSFTSAMSTTLSPMELLYQERTLAQMTTHGLMSMDLAMVSVSEIVNHVPKQMSFSAPICPTNYNADCSGTACICVFFPSEPSAWDQLRTLCNNSGSQLTVVNNQYKWQQFENVSVIRRFTETKK
jgi:hypothetical protein